ncbi:MFS transporter [Sphingomonas colocasiae]|uniref:Glycoside-pentoside-hexuronide (GPH):cation symporter n=1 Tax=Sphingomonas colocasiae TaxID=1848973 RepID=A0ABS7PK16_9SPHN|nr:glycoside-pentoside-hexuronide (GPH):cation symporter [Sphingomonas colocasiae]MBY8821637.1 glycoside-pentoside-hexuronide (GPH):cation symporter [Sphingomonas colocasiae]
MTGAARTRLGYALGCFGTDLFWQSTSFYLLFYYTDILHLPNAAAGLIFGAAMIWDGLIDPLVGMFANRIRSRLGRYRLLVLIGAAPLSLSFMLVFAQPLLGLSGEIWFALLAQMLFRTAYAVVSIPYGSLSASLTTSMRERSTLATFKVLGGAAAALAVALASQPFVALWQDPALGWFALAMLWGALAFAALLFMVLATHEIAEDGQAAPPIAALMRAILCNRPLLLLLAAITAMSIGTVISGKMIVYYFTYYVGRPELASYGLAVQVAAVILLTPVWGWVGRSFSKRLAWLWGSGLSCAGQAAFIAYTGGDPAIVLVLLALTWLGGAAIPVTLWSLIPDTVEVAEWRTGIRAEGMTFGIVTLVQKVATGLAIALCGVLLDLIGYVAAARQSPETLTGFHLMLTVPTLLGGAISMAFMWFYVIDEAFHNRLLRALAYRRR